MKTIVGLIISLFLLLGNLGYADYSASDIAGHKYNESIQYLYDHWIVKWYDNWTFWPDLEITRAEIMKIITKSSAGEIAESEKDNCFYDVNENEWFSPYICFAKKKNIVKWYDNGTFWPYKKIIFAEALKMAIESFGYVLNGNSNDKWYQKYLDFVHENNIFSKYGISPIENITRGEMSYLIHQLMLEKNWDVSVKWIRNSKSAWCGKNPPSTPPTSSIVDWINRGYITEVWKKYNQNKPIKLIFAFHGRTNSNEMVRGYYDVNEAVNWNAIIVYPSWLPENSSPRNWSNPWDRSDELRDLKLFDKLLEEFSKNYCIDLDQVFVVWHSLWAWFTNSLSCLRGDVIRWIWAVGGWTTINNCNGNVAAIIMQNPKDNLSPYSAAVTALNQTLEQNGCTNETEKYGSLWNCVKYTNCIKGAPVIRCPYSESTNFNWSYYPHLWPDYAGKTIIDFFESL